MSDALDRRAAQKARTRARLIEVARDRFADLGFEPITISDIAATAGVSVQTVFNHFSSKEELFFAERAEWVEGPAEAVRTRGAGTAPKEALRRHLVAAVEGYMTAATTCPQHRRMVEVLLSSPALQSYERTLHEQAVVGLAAALAEAWGCDEDDPTSPCDPVLAEVTASVWMAAVRSVLLDKRGNPPGLGDESAVRATVELVDRVLAELENGLTFERTAALATAGRG